jgi:phosphoribosylanthranilate isomerase
MTGSRSSIPFTIKICGITNVEDGQQAVDAGATALGFNFYKRSPRYVSPAEAKALASEIKGTYLKVGVFANATREELEEARLVAQLDVLQLHGTIPTELPAGVRLWRAVAATELPVPEARFELYLIDTPSRKLGGSGQTFDWKLVANFSHPFVLAGGLGPDNVGAAIAAVQPAGVDACSRLEAEPGRKNRALVAQFIERALAGSAKEQLTT